MKKGRKAVTRLNLILNSMRLYDRIRDNVDGINAGYQWVGWFDKADELHEIKHMVYSYIRI